MQPFFTEKGFHYQQKFTIKTKRGVTSSEKTTEIFSIFRKFYIIIKCGAFCDLVPNT